MAKVKNQSIPTDQFEETLDPPIDFKDQYRRSLSEGIDHPKLPAGEEIVTYSKKDSRPSQRSSSKYRKSIKQDEQRDRFIYCSTCWRSQYDTDAEVNQCSSKTSKHYVKPWTYVPGAKFTYFNQFMSQCMHYRRNNPDYPFPPCEDLSPSPIAFDFCPGDQVQFSVSNAINPWSVTPECGEMITADTWQAPASYAGCPNVVIFAFADAIGKKGCAFGNKKPEEDCCCANPPALAISYATLAMQCSQQQTLSVDPDIPGCPPYTWSLVGGGSLNTTEGSSVIYTAPSSNAGCSSNPNISVEDACGTVFEISIAVNCNTGGLAAYALWSWVDKDYGCVWDPPLWRFYWIMKTEYHCDGTVHSGPTHTYETTLAQNFPPSTPNEVICAKQTGTSVCSVCHGVSRYPTTLIGIGLPDVYDGRVDDVRTPAMKTAGCCPINPETGLPL
jgi:hypothetical protein